MNEWSKNEDQTRKPALQTQTVWCLSLAALCSVVTPPGFTVLVPEVAGLALGHRALVSMWAALPSPRDTLAHVGAAEKPSRPRDPFRPLPTPNSPSRAATEEHGCPDAREDPSLCCPLCRSPLLPSCSCLRAPHGVLKVPRPWVFPFWRISIARRRGPDGGRRASSCSARGVTGGGWLLTLSGVLRGPRAMAPQGASAEGHGRGRTPGSVGPGRGTGASSPVPRAWSLPGASP